MAFLSNETEKRAGEKHLIFDTFIDKWISGLHLQTTCLFPKQAYIDPWGKGENIKYLLIHRIIVSKIFAR